MIEGIGKGVSAARTAIEAAQKRQTDALRRMEEAVSGKPTAQAPDENFSSALTDSIKSVNSDAMRHDRLLTDTLTGNVSDVSEVAVQLQQSSLSVRFALEVRNKFIDAYREVMRMSV
jgi:flagellar hook-basal body complex protein FliE